MKLLVLLAVLLEELVPLLLSSSTLGGVLVVHVVDLLGNSEHLLGVETELLLDLLAVVGLEGVSVDTAGTLELGTETDGGSELDHRRLVGDLLGLSDGLLNALEVGVTVLDVQYVPSVGLESLHDILSEGALGVTVCMTSVPVFPFELSTKLTNGDVVVIVDGNEVSELQVTGSGGSLAGNTLHSATITEEHVDVVVDQLVAGLVEDGGGVLLSNSETDGIGETLTKRASGDLDTGGVVGLGVTGCDAVDLLQRN